MKLKNKLLYHVGLLIFITLILFSYFLIQASFNKDLRKSFDSGISEYYVIYSNIKTGENLKNLLLTNNEIIKIKSEIYLNNKETKNLSLEFRNKDMEVIYSSDNKTLSLPLEIYDVIDGKHNYILHEENKTTYLVINNIISLNGSNLYFTYKLDLSPIYISKNNSFLAVCSINTIVTLLLIVFIYLISSEITNPLNTLIKNINKVIDGNYNETIVYTGDIDEISKISHQFNLMSGEINNKINLLKRQNKEKERFINNLTHEIRTPLTSIIGFSSLMLDKDVKDITLLQNSLKTINKDGKRLLDLSKTLVKLITLDNASIEIQSVDLKNILNDLHERFSLKLKENNISFNITGKNLIILGDYDLISILLSNFIDNSIKAINKDCINKSINITINENCITIADTGKGISKENLNKIWEPFYMDDNSRHKSINGFGFGLSICKEILKLHNIKCDITSQLNIGTTITLYFNKET
ncbi:sensor histidine kinase [Clostridium sp.]|uniref:sensor histidine kinase n=1 Tax=Clostridium sp. TaxID=1506 RepID=UPI003F2AC785